MSIGKIRNNLRTARRRIHNAFSPVGRAILIRFHPWIESAKLGAKKPQMFAYRIIGRKVTKFLPLFKDMDVNLRKSGMNTSFKAYASLTILAALLVPVFVLVLIPLLLILFFHLPFFPCLLLGTGISSLVGALTVIAFYVYPIYRADILKRDLEDGLCFSAGYMSILAGAGVTPEHIFRSLAQADHSSAVSKESKTILRDVGLFGSDILSTLETSANRSPSERFKQFLQGFVATVHSGAGLEKYLANRSRQYMRLKRIDLRRFSDSLAVLAEFYVSLLVAGPLILVVMLAVMGMLGGREFGFFDPSLLLQILTYLGVPTGSVVFLIILDAVSPRW